MPGRPTKIFVAMQIAGSVVALGVAAGVNAKRPIATLLMVAMGVFIFFTYPSGTNAIVAAVTFLTFFITKPNGSPIRPYVAMAAGVFILAFAVLNFNSTAGVASDYFNAVQKKNNNNARIALYQNGFQTFLQSPIVGSVFTGNITELVIRRDGLGAPFKAPFHDDYIMFSAVGGSVGLLLLFPPTRVLARRVVKNRFHGRVIYFEGLPRNGRLDGPDDVIDV